MLHYSDSPSSIKIFSVYLKNRTHVTHEFFHAYDLQSTADHIHRISDGLRHRASVSTRRSANQARWLRDSIGRFSGSITHARAPCSSLERQRESRAMGGPVVFLISLTQPSFRRTLGCSPSGRMKPRRNSYKAKLVPVSRSTESDSFGRLRSQSTTPTHRHKVLRLGLWAPCLCIDL